MTKKIVEIAIMAWPVCYERLAYLCETIDALKSNLTGECEFRWSCNAESSPQGELWFGNELEEISIIAGLQLTWRKGLPDLGSNINETFRRSTSDYIFLCQEDRVLNKPLDLTNSVELLEKYPKIAAVWYDWLPPGNSSWGKIGEFWLNSPTSIWLIADREMLIRRSFTRRFGLWLEGKPLGIAEMEMNRRMKRFCTTVAHPKEVYFDHRGDVGTIPRIQEELYHVG